MQLIQREKMASMGQLVAGVAHELNNPIGFVYSNVTTLEDFVTRLRGMLEVYRGLSLPPETRDQVQAEWERRKIDYALRYLDSMTQGIREGAERARKIVRDLRVFARSQDDVWQPVDLHEEIESSLTLLNHLLKDRVTVHRKLGDLPPVECIRSSIDQVFLNLLANAAQAIEGPGAITIETRREDDMAVIIVADTGPGIAPDVIGRVFDPFFTTKTVGEGTGLGLSISYEIVKKHGGEILRREPRRRRRGLHGAPAHRPQGSGVTAEATVLIVDDEVRVLDSLEALLAMDYRVLRAERPEAALDLLAAEPVALVISDQRMPGMTGTEFLARCREVSPEAVRVLLTAFTDADALMESINAANIYHFILEAMGPHRAASTPSAAASSGTGLPPSGSSSCATWRRRTPTSRRRSSTCASPRTACCARPPCGPSSSATSRRGSRRWRSAARACSTGPGTGARPRCSSPTSAATRASSRPRRGPWSSACSTDISTR